MYVDGHKRLSSNESTFLERTKNGQDARVLSARYCINAQYMVFLFEEPCPTLKFSNIILSAESARSRQAITGREPKHATKLVTPSKDDVKMGDRVDRKGMYTYFV